MCFPFSKKSVAPTSVTGVTLNKTSTSIAVGANETLVATVTPGDAANKNISFSSSDTSVATVTPKAGKVTGVSPGTATITVTTEDAGKTSNCDVTVS
ncbi:Ig-like domain-containing protein [Enterococcus sp. AZ103]|uniref:Ig-like domain-containing protein n=1 Tax=Enterococcus sp. AZ103 TaxID=2774628 RepID=UPI003F68794D